MDINQLFHKLTACTEVEALALGGSRATNNYDQTSDYDVYVYLTSDLSDEKRAFILSDFCSEMEIGNRYWELEDNCTLKDGTDIDIIYRSLDDFDNAIGNVVNNFIVSYGYTTSMWHNLMTCKIIYDSNGRLQDLKNKYDVMYPQKLKETIIKKNMNLLSGVLPSYDLQIKKAISRKDLVSVNHRVTEFLACYFDIIFALNEKTHPGEKRLVGLCKDQCTILPLDFEENLDKLFQVMYTDEVVTVITILVNQLRKVITL